MFFVPSCFGILDVHLFVHYEMGFGSVLCECNNVVLLQSFAGSLKVM